MQGRQEKPGRGAEGGSTAGLGFSPSQATQPTCAQTAASPSATPVVVVCERGGRGEGWEGGQKRRQDAAQNVEAQSVGLVKLLGICLHHTQRLPYPLDASTYPPTCCTTGTSTVPTRVSVTPVPVAPSV